MKKIKTGMSMIEILIGVILLALIIVPSLNVILSQTKTVTSTRDHSQAAFVAQKIQEILRSYKFSLIEAEQYAADQALQKRTFEWKLKNSDELKKQVINNIVYLIDDVKIDAVKNPAAGPEQAICAYVVSYSIKYTGKDMRNHRLDISTAISLRD